MAIDYTKFPYAPMSNPMGLLNNTQPNNFAIDSMQIQQAINQKKIDEEQQQRKRADQSMKLQQFADTMRMINANKSGNYGASKIFSDRIAQRKALFEQKQKREEFKKNNPGMVDMLEALEVGIPASVFNKGQTYKPDLRTYKNVTKENIQIGNVILKPNESRPFNISNPTIANALMNTSGIDEVSKGTVYTRQGGLYDTPDGTYRELLVGDKQMFKGPGGTFTTEQFYAKYPANKISTTTSAEGYRYDADLKTFNKMNTDLVAIEKSMFQTENYWKNVKDSNVGISRLGDQISQWFTTLAGSKDLTPKELYRALAEGQLQGLIGANRIDTVGGGVMTEKDAWRVIARLGGDVDSLQNPAIVGPLLEEMYNLKVFDYNQQIKAYNNAVETGNFKGYKKREPITAEEVINKFSLLPENIPPGSKKVTINNQTLYQDGDTYYAVVNGEVVEVDIDG